MDIVKENWKIVPLESRDGDKMAPSVEKKIAELEMGLMHLQQNIDIPEINLVIHPTVLAAIKKAGEEGRKTKVADFGDKIEDATFLNALQSGVNRWIREIQKVRQSWTCLCTCLSWYSKLTELNFTLISSENDNFESILIYVKVTKLDRDPASGTALQEISFWLNLERALLRIQEKRESTEIALTLDILKHGKRFHATVSFDTDTGTYFYWHIAAGWPRNKENREFGSYFFQTGKTQGILL